MKKDRDKILDLGFWGNLKQTFYELRRKLMPKPIRRGNGSMKKGMWAFSYAVWALPFWRES